MYALVRLDPEELPKGEIKVIPSFSYLMLEHKNVDAYRCEANLIKTDSTHHYFLNYPDLQREVDIAFDGFFPHSILSLKETIPCEECEGGFSTSELSCLKTSSSGLSTKSSPCCKNTEIFPVFKLK